MKHKSIIKKITAVVVALTMAFSTAVVYGAETEAVPYEDGALQTAFAKPERPDVTAKSGIVIDGETGNVIYSKNPDIKRDPYSVTKLLTALIALEHLDPEQVVTMGKTAMNAPDKTGGFVYGEKVRVKDLIYALMLPSSNESAVQLAMTVSGSEKKFAVLMNEKAKALGCKNSNFVNPYGWKNKNHYSTARDMAKITKSAMENSLIEKACSTEIYKIPKTNKHNARKIATTNSFVAKKKYPKSGVYAGKTGTWDFSNATLASACKRDGKVVYAVVLKDVMSNRYSSTNKILNYSYKKLDYMNQAK